MVRAGPTVCRPGVVERGRPGIVFVITIPVHGTSGDGAGISERHLTVAATSDKAEARNHLKKLHGSTETYFVTAGRRLNESCVVSNVAQELWGPMDASRARWAKVAESNGGRDHVMHIAGATPGERFSLQPSEAQLLQIVTY